MNTAPNNTSRKRKVARTFGWVALPVGVTAIFGVGCIDGPLGLLLQLGLLLLGVTPSANFADNGQVEFNVLQVAEDGTPIEKDDSNNPLDSNNAAPDTEDPDVAENPDVTGEPVADNTDVKYHIDVTAPPGTTATVETIVVEATEEVGTFSVILDSSGSMERTYQPDENGVSVCATCPHDPERRRVAATQALTKEILARSPESRLGIFDFGAGPSEESDFKVTRVLQNYTSDASLLNSGAELTEGAEGTYIYDSAMEVLDLMNGDIQQHFQTKPITKAIIVISDGEDTESTRTLQDVITRANELEIPIHVVAIGKASDKFMESYQTDDDNTAIVTDFQRLANETGGFYATVSNNDDLVALAEAIALGLTGGYEKLVTTIEPIPTCGTVVKGKIYAGDPSADPELEGQDWSFVAPCN